MSLPVFLVLFAALQNIDNLVLAAAYRWQNVQIGARSNLLIAGLSGLFTGLGVLGARVTTSEASRVGLDNYSEIVGRGILIMIGLWTLLGYFRARLFPQPRGTAAQPPPGAPANQLTPLRFKEAAVVGTALAVDNLGPSFAFGLVNFNYSSVGVILSTFVALMSVLAVAAGQALGKTGERRLQSLSPKLVAGCLIVGIALFHPDDVAREHLRWLGMK